MVVALAVFDFHLPDCRGLKEKRAFLRPLKSRLRGGFEISASEVAHHDLLQRAAVGVAAVGPALAAPAAAQVESALLSKVVEYVEGWAEESGVELTSLRSEFLEYGDVGAPGASFGAEEEAS